MLQVELVRKLVATELKVNVMTVVEFLSPANVINPHSFGEHTLFLFFLNFSEPEELPVLIYSLGQFFGINWPQLAVKEIYNFIFALGAQKLPAFKV